MGLFDDFALFDDIRAAAQEFREVASDITSEIVAAGEEAIDTARGPVDDVTNGVSDAVTSVREDLSL